MTDAPEQGLGIWFEGQTISELIPHRYAEFSINVKELCVLDRFLDLLPEVRDTIDMESR